LGHDGGYRIAIGLEVSAIFQTERERIVGIATIARRAALHRSPPGIVQEADPYEMTNIIKQPEAVGIVEVMNREMQRLLKAP
jgi:hypothetical protein